MRKFTRSNLLKRHYEATRILFDKYAVQKGGFYDSQRSLAYKAQKRIRDRIIAFISDENPDKILDAGCGRGDFSLVLAHRFPNSKVIGVDFSDKMLKLANELSKGIDNLSFNQSDLLALPFREDEFDITICLNTTHHIHQDDFTKVISELARVTKGTLVIEFKNKQTIFWPIMRFLFGRSHNRMVDLYGHTVSEISCLLLKDCFVLQELFPIFKITFLLNFNKLIF